MATHLHHRVSVATDFAPAKLLCNGTTIRALQERISAVEPETKIAFAYITTPQGGAEHRPYVRFDRLPVEPLNYDLLPDRKKPTFVFLATEPAGVAYPVGTLAPIADHNRTRFQDWTIGNLFPNLTVGVRNTPQDVEATTLATGPVPVMDPTTGRQAETLYKRVTVKGKKAYLRLDNGETATVRYTRTGTGRAARYTPVN